MIQYLKIVDDYDDIKVYAAVSAALDALGAASDIKPGMRIVIKPNLITLKAPSTAAVTHPAVVGAVARWLSEHGADNVTLAESPGGPYNSEYIKRVYHISGMDGIGYGLRLNGDFSSQPVYCPESFANRSFNIITPIANADYIIDICKLKTHAMTGFSGGIKNLFGVIPGLEKPQIHYRWPQIEDFSRMLVELAQTVKPALTVIDAVEAMEGNGPTGGSVYPLHMLLASRDLYTQDCFAARLMGLDPREIVMLRQALDAGLARPGEITLAGDAPPEGLTPFRRPDAISLDFTDNLPGFLKKPFAFFAGKILKSYPVLRPAHCIGCGKCAESCPAKIIQIVNGKAKFTRRGCISCFCCQEMCPAKAISVRRAL